MIRLLAILCLMTAGAQSQSLAQEPDSLRGASEDIEHFNQTYAGRWGLTPSCPAEGLFELSTERFDLYEISCTPESMSRTLDGLAVGVSCSAEGEPSPYDLLFLQSHGEDEIIINAGGQMWDRVRCETDKAKSIRINLEQDVCRPERGESIEDALNRCAGGDWCGGPDWYHLRIDDNNFEDSWHACRIERVRFDEDSMSFETISDCLSPLHSSVIRTERTDQFFIINGTLSTSLRPETFNRCETPSQQGAPND